MLLRSPGFLRVYCSQLLSLLGDQLYLIALPWVVLELTGSALALGTVFALGAFPRALLFPVGGALADRVEASRLMVASGFARGLVIAGLAALLGAGQTWAPYLVAVLLGAAASFYYPAESSLLPRLLPRDLLQSANGLVQGANQLAGVLGPALGGAVVGALGGEAALAIAAGTYTLAAVVMLGVRVRRGRGAGGLRAAFPGDLREGLGVAWGDPVIRWLIVTAAFGNLGFAGPLFVGIPALVRGPLGLGPVAFGMLDAAFAAGAVGGAMSLALIGRRIGERRGGLAVAALLVQSLAFGALGMRVGFGSSFGLMLLSGACSGLANALLITLLQLRAPEEFLGRVMGLVYLGSFGLIPVSQLLAGTVAEAFGVRAVFPLGASVMFLALVAGGRWLVRSEAAA